MGASNGNCPCLNNNINSNTKIVKANYNKYNKMNAFIRMIDLLKLIRDTKKILMIETFIISSKTIKNYIN